MIVGKAPAVVIVTEKEERGDRETKNKDDNDDNGNGDGDGDDRLENSLQSYIDKLVDLEPHRAELCDLQNSTATEKEDERGDREAKSKDDDDEYHNGNNGDGDDRLENSLQSYVDKLVDLEPHRAELRDLQNSTATEKEEERGDCEAKNKDDDDNNGNGNTGDGDDRLENSLQSYVDKLVDLEPHRAELRDLQKRLERLQRPSSQKRIVGNDANSDNNIAYVPSSTLTPKIVTPSPSAPVVAAEESQSPMSFARWLITTPVTTPIPSMDDDSGILEARSLGDASDARDDDELGIPKHNLSSDEYRPFFGCCVGGDGIDKFHKT